MKKILLTFIAALALLISINGCGKNNANPALRKVVAKINNYELTTDDFRDEAKLIMENKYYSGNPAKVQEDLLDEMIDKKLLLQEAQRRNFDKDAAFMKEIERYWEQALLKRLIREKMDELSRGITVSEAEVRDEYDRLAKQEGAKISPFEDKAAEIKNEIYNRKIQDSLDAWMRGLRMKADVKIYKAEVGDLGT